MKALVVNGFSKSNKNDQKQFDTFCDAVIEGFDKIRSKLIGDPQIEICHHTELDDYLYETNTEFNDPEAKKRFDYLDLVFIDGDVNYLPWQK